MWPPGRLGPSGRVPAHLQERFTEDLQICGAWKESGKRPEPTVHRRAGLPRVRVRVEGPPPPTPPPSDCASLCSSRLPNLSQTCYMNSVLQSLLTLTPFVEELTKQSQLWCLHPRALLFMYGTRSRVCATSWLCCDAETCLSAFYFFQFACRG